MAIPPVDMAGAAGPVVNAAADALGFDNALNNALGGALGGGDAAMIDQMVQGAIPIMGQIMMRHAGEMLNEAMADDEG